METLIEAADRFGRVQAEVCDFLPTEAVQKIAKVENNIWGAVRQTLAVTGVDVSRASITDLPGNVVGQFDTRDKGIKFDEEIITSNKLVHVATHEGWHAANDNKAGGVRLDTSFEEGLTEEATKETTRISMAYDREQQMVGEVAQAVGETKSKLVRLFKNGENRELNGYWAEYLEKRAA